MLIVLLDATVKAMMTMNIAQQLKLPRMVTRALDSDLKGVDIESLQKCFQSNWHLDSIMNWLPTVIERFEGASAVSGQGASSCKNRGKNNKEMGRQPGVRKQHNYNHILQQINP
ncbi:hypothetical protein Tco_0742526 [Tanacetum coccineum]